MYILQVVSNTRAVFCRSGTSPDEELALRHDMISPEKQQGNLTRWLLFAKYCFCLYIVPFLARMRFTGSKHCHKGRLQLALAHRCGIMKHSNKTNVFGREREREGNWKGQESGRKYTMREAWSPTVWKRLWHGCLVKINHISASARPHFRDVSSLDTLFPCLGHQSKAILG